MTHHERIAERVPRARKSNKVEQVLRSQQVRARVRGSTIEPQFVNTERSDLRKISESLVGLLTVAREEGWTRGQLLDGMRDQIGTHRSAKVLRGMVKLLEDRCTFEVDTPIEPIELRRRVFEHARERGPLALAPDPLGRPLANDILAEVGETLGMSAKAVGAALYGDLKDAQTLTEVRPISADELLHRYNVALVQGLLLKATALEVTLHAPTVPRLRQLLRHAKFHQLIHRAHRDDDLVTLTFDGPASILHQSTRYGLALAKFFPAILLQDGNWQLTAEVLWTKAKHRKKLTLNHQAPLRSHLRDTGAYFTREHQWFLERWHALDDPHWSISEDTLPIQLGGRAILLPDFQFTRDGRTAYLEIVGYWRRGYLERRLEAIRRYGPGNMILAVSKRLGSEAKALQALGAEVITFGQILPPKAVLAAVESVAV